MTYPPPGTPRARIPSPLQPPPPYPRIRAGLWRRLLSGGLAVWALTALATYATADTALLPTVILLGGLLLPVAFVLWAYERHGHDLGVSAVLGCFLAGGTLGVLGASVTEQHPLHPSLRMFAGAGLTEAVKLGALMFVLRRLRGIHGMRAGLVLGAAVGCGFAALESSGHAFGTALSTDGLGLRTLLETETLHGILAPLGHGLWTAIAGGALLAHRRPNGRFRLGGPVLGAWLGAGLLHTLWDSTHGVALWLVTQLAGPYPARQLFAQGYVPRPTALQEHLLAVFSVGGLVLVSLLGIARVRSLARRGASWRNTP
ncbi:PrsW family glutamic-type intramembrane protease [Streptomyces sp. NPDC046915]|uniref:PrsW family glutamic-type intramembrane protease n=1 Tax=Streptomyces sp. NPDC046915 TaxID=3155257 RepID=UPI0033CAEABC